MDETVRDKVKKFFEAYQLRHAAKGQVIVYAGDDPRGVFYLIKGQVQQYDIAPNGEQIVVNLFKPPTFFPMSWAINKTPNQYFFEAASAIDYRLAPADEVVRFLHDNPDVTFDLLARVYSGADGMLRRMAHLMGGNARTRILFEVMVQTRRFGESKDDGSYLVPLNEHDLAKRAGLSRETVSRELGHLKELVTVSREGMLVHDLAELENVLDAGL